MAKHLKRYPHLTRADLPRLVQEGLKTYGVREAPGAASNATILGWAKEVDALLGNLPYNSDAIPWCGLWMAVISKRAGWSDEVPRQPLWALHWATFGNPSDTPSLGDVLVFTRPIVDPKTGRRRTGGHVGLYVAEDDAAYHVLGGNQSDSVNIARIAKSRLYEARRPPWRVRQPSSVKPYRVSGLGRLSTNEA